MLRVERKIGLVTRPTRLEGVIAEHGTASQAKFRMIRAKQAAPRRQVGTSVLEAAREDEVLALGAARDFDRLHDEDFSYRSLLARLRTELGELAPVHMLDRMYLPRYVFGPEDVVVTLGQDGLVANCAKYALGRPIVGVNPDPRQFDGILLPFTADEAASAVRGALRGHASVRHVTLAEATLVDGQRLLAFNDLFIGARTHVSARYRLRFGGNQEQQSSSGVIVSTGAGSTGWLSSVVNMAQAVVQLTGRGTGARHPLKIAWDDPKLIFVVREPFLSKASGIAISGGIVSPGEELVIESSMSREGVVFSDGIEADFLEFNAGAIARIGIAKERAHLVVKR
jgi:NAD kinase